jgi:hypothetical protein
MTQRFCQNPFDITSLKNMFPNMKLVDNCLQKKNNENYDSWKDHYIPLVKENIDDTEEDIIKISCDETQSKWFKMTYKNIMNYGTEEQQIKYNEQRTRYLCYLMKTITDNTGFCYKMMGSAGAASDVDISIIPLSLYPDVGTPIEIIKKFYEKHAETFNDGPSTLFDANIYGTNFTQIFTIDTKDKNDIDRLVANNQIQMATNLALSTDKLNEECFAGSEQEMKIKAISTYIQAPKDVSQMGFATYKLAKTYDFDIDMFANDILSVANQMNKDVVRRSISSELGPAFKESQGVYEKYERFKSNTTSRSTTYETLLKAYYTKRQTYFATEYLDEKSKLNSALDIVNTLSAATLYEDESYHSQGAFMDVNVVSTGSFNFSLAIHEYQDSILENMGFITEYADSTKHHGSTYIQRLEKIIKYFERICNSLQKIWNIFLKGDTPEFFKSHIEPITEFIEINRKKSDDLNRVRKLKLSLDFNDVITFGNLLKINAFQPTTNEVSKEMFDSIVKTILLNSFTWFSETLSVSYQLKNVNPINSVNSYNIKINANAYDNANTRQNGGRKKQSKSKKSTTIKKEVKSKKKY